MSLADKHEQSVKVRVGTRHPVTLMFAAGGNGTILPCVENHFGVGHYPDLVRVNTEPQDIGTVSAVLQAAERNLLGCDVCDDSKGHGLQKQVSGSSVAGRKVAIVDDTCSSGHSLLKCAETVEQHGGDVVQVIALFDRDAGDNAVKAAGYRYDYALRVSPDGNCQPQPK